MFQTWWHSTMDARRAIGLLIDVAGLALVALSVAVSSVPLALDGTLLLALCSPALGAAAGGYVGHRSSGPRRARLWAFAYGISSGALIAGMFAAAALLRPTVAAMPGLADSWAGLFVGGCLLGFVGALLWERDPRRRRVSAWLLLAVGLIAGGAVVSVSRGPWTAPGALVFLAGFGVLLYAIVRSVSLQESAGVPALWPPAPAPAGPTQRPTPRTGAAPRGHGRLRAEAPTMRWRAGGGVLAGWIAVLAIAAIGASSSSLGELFPIFREIVGWTMPGAPWSQLVPCALVVLAVVLGAALGPLTEDSLVGPAILASATIGAVATGWVFVLAAGADRPVGVAIEMTAIFAGTYLTIAIGSVLPLSLAWAWILRTAARRVRSAGLA